VFSAVRKIFLLILFQSFFGLLLFYFILLFGGSKIFLRDRIIIDNFTPLRGTLFHFWILPTKNTKRKFNAATLVPTIWFSRYDIMYI